MATTISLELVYKNVRALMLPPFSYQAVLRGDCPNREPLEQFMQQAAQICHHYGAPDLQLLGPVSPVMERRARALSHAINAAMSATHALYSIICNSCYLLLII